MAFLAAIVTETSFLYIAVVQTCLYFQLEWDFYSSGSLPALWTDVCVICGLNGIIVYSKLTMHITQEN